MATGTMTTLATGQNQPSLSRFYVFKRLNSAPAANVGGSVCVCVCGRGDNDDSELTHNSQTYTYMFKNKVSLTTEQLKQSTCHI